MAGLGEFTRIQYAWLQYCNYVTALLEGLLYLSIS